MITFEESGMIFSLPQDKGCHIEASPLYGRLLSRGVKSVECLFLKKRDIVCVVEAKSSSPCVENKKDLDKYLQDIRTKYVDTLLMIYAAVSNIQKMTDMAAGNRLEAVLKGKVQYHLVIIVNGYSAEGCRQLDLVIKKVMADIIHILGAQVFVINEDRARKCGIIR